MSDIHDGPCSPHFAPLPFAGNANLSTLAAAAATAVPAGMTAEMAAALGHAPGGRCTSWGISFDIGNVVILSDKPVSVEISPIQARWLVFLHTSDIRPLSPGPGGIISPLRGSGQLAEHAADYVVYYAGGAEARVEIRRRRQLGPFDREWGENCFEAVSRAAAASRTSAIGRPATMRGAGRPASSAARRSNGTVWEASVFTPVIQVMVPSACAMRTPRTRSRALPYRQRSGPARLTATIPPTVARSARGGSSGQN